MCIVQYASLCSAGVYFYIELRAFKGRRAGRVRGYSRGKTWGIPCLPSCHACPLRTRAQALQMVVRPPRWKKCAKWMADPRTAYKLSIGCVLAEPGLHMLGTFFARSRLGTEIGRSSMTSFASPTTSPAEATMKELIGLLEDPGSPRWLPVIGSEGWTQEHIHNILMLTLTFMGSIFLRCCLPFEQWPWILCKLIHADTGQGTKDEILQAWWSVSDCCTSPSDGFTRPLRKTFQQPEQMTSRQVLELLEDSFMMTDASNIRVEDRFARVRRHTACNQGRAAGPPTVCSNHALSEFTSMYRVAKERCKA